MEYSEYRGFTSPGYLHDAHQLWKCQLSISAAHVMLRALGAGYRHPDDGEQDDVRDLPDGFLSAVARHVFELAGNLIDEELFEAAIEHEAEDWGLVCEAGEEA